MTAPLEYAEAVRSSNRRRIGRIVGVLLGVALFSALSASAWRMRLQIRTVVSIRHAYMSAVPAEKVVLDETRKSGTAFTYAVSSARVYQHTARFGNKSTRLIEVSADTTSTSESPEMKLYAQSSSVPTFMPGSRQKLLSMHLLNITADKLYSGQPDPKDESHFTIRFELAGKSNTIDGWLMSDDTVKLEPRN